MNLIHSIKFRFTVWYLLVLVVLLASLSTIVYFYLSRTLYQNLDASLELRTTQLQDLPAIVDSIREGQFQEELGEIVMLCFHSQGELVKLSPNEIDVPLTYAFVEEAIGGQASFTTVRTAEGEGVRLCAVPFEGGRRGGLTEPAAVVVGRSTQETEQALDGLTHTLVIVVPLTLLLAAGGGVFLARRALKPVDQISETARTISESDLSGRIQVDTRDELGRLASTLNQMIERLQRAFKRQQQFTGDASHELRTPLAVIQAESSLALQRERPADEYRQSLQTITQEADHMSSMIDRLLVLARADVGREQLALERVSLGGLVQDVSTDVEILCREKGLGFKLNQTGEVVVEGDRAMLRQLLLDLLDNAIRYTPKGGTVSVSLRREGRMAVVSVADAGIGIPSEDLPLIFERFYRVDKARSRSEGGSGLGLAICQRIAEAHGGRIKVESQVGKGSTFSVWLPAVLP